MEDSLDDGEDFAHELETEELEVGREFYVVIDRGYIAGVFSEKVKAREHLGTCDLDKGFIIEAVIESFYP